MTTAFTIFVKQAVREQRILFIISRDVPNQQTMQAIEEIQMLKKVPNKKVYASFSELLEDVQNEV